MLFLAHHILGPARDGDEDCHPFWAQVKLVASFDHMLFEPDAGPVQVPEFVLVQDPVGPGLPVDQRFAVPIAASSTVRDVDGQLRGAYYATFPEDVQRTWAYCRQNFAFDRL